ELAALGARAVGQHLAAHHALALAHDRLLVDARVLVRAAELDERVDVGAEVAADGGVVLALDPDDDALRVDAVDDARALGHDDGTRVPRHDALHAGAH